MLGSVTARSDWTWSAEGKHPSARDYITIGTPSPLATSLAKWVSDGYRAVSAAAVPPGHRFWRFWLKGMQKDQLSCGLLRDSCDSIGRPYPLTVLGTGPAAGWEQQWGLLPAACAGVWQAMEQVSAQAYRDVAALERQLVALKPPSRDLVKLQAEMLLVAGADHSTAAGIGSPGGELVTAADDPGKVVIAMSAVTTVDQVLPHLAAQFPVTPSAVFFGGLPASPRMILLMRPLKHDDFKELWARVPA